jgi:selenocysteine lyase/cysteine desulfurase
MSLKEKYFPDLEPAAYLNHAGISPLARPVLAAIQRTSEAYARGGSRALRHALAEREVLREQLARLAGVDPTWVGITQSTSTGLLWVAMGFPWRQGDRVALLRGEFPANILPWQLAASLYGLEIQWLDLAELKAICCGATWQPPRLLALSWVQFQTGEAVSLAELAKLRKISGCAVCLDAIQGLGALTMDWQANPLDFACGGGHKWLLGPEGCGYVIASPEWVSNFRPVCEGWLGLEKPVDFLLEGPGLLDYQRPLRRAVSRIEFCAQNQLGISGLRASTGMMLELGAQEMSSRILATATSLRQGLTRRGLALGSHHSGIVSFLPGPGSSDLRQLLGELETSGVVGASPDGHLRFSPHFHTSEVEVALALSAVDRLLARGWLKLPMA